MNKNGASLVKSIVTCLVIGLNFHFSNSFSPDASAATIGRTNWNKTADGAQVTFLSAAAPSGTGTSPYNRSSYLYTFETPKVEKKGEFDFFTIPGTETWDGNPGAPMVPFRAARLFIPNNQTLASVRIIQGPKSPLSGTYKIKPTQELVVLDEPMVLEPTKPDPQIYGSDIVYPEVACGDMLIQSKHGYKVVVINLFPLEYIPATGQVSYYQEMTIQLETLKPVATGMMAAPAPGTILPQAKYSDEIGTFIDNPQDLNNFSAGSQTKALAAAPGAPCEYLVITKRDFKNATGDYTLQTLVNSKSAKGITAMIATVEDDIYPNYSGKDNPEKIRNFIIDYYQNHGTVYVLLAGDASSIPPRLLYAEARDRKDTYKAQFAADMYYACLDGTFDNNDNGIYGEPNDGPNGGEVDLMAEVYVGRIPAYTTTGISNFVRKTLSYENSKSPNLRKVVFLGELLNLGGTDTYGSYAMEQLRNGSTDEGFTTIGFTNATVENTFVTQTLYDDRAAWNTADLVNLMNNGCHIINHLGHGSTTSAMKLSLSNIFSLTNNDYFFVYSQTCLAGGFDLEPDCIASTFTTSKNGAVAVIMNARWGFGEVETNGNGSERFNRYFWDALLAKGLNHLAKLNQYSKEANIPAINGQAGRMICYELNLLGDPELSIKTTTGSDLKIVSPTAKSYVRGNQVAIRGSAALEDLFQSYELSYAPKSKPTNITAISSSTTPVTDGVLGVWDTTACPSDGTYILTLKMTSVSGRVYQNSLEVLVDNVDQAPSFTYVNDKAAVIGRLLEFQVQAQDPDDPMTPNGQLVYSIEGNMPSDAAFNAGTRTFSWNPAESEKGTYKIFFNVQDCLAKDQLDDKHLKQMPVTLTTVSVRQEQITFDDSIVRSYPDIYKDKIVWQDHRNGNADIYAYDLARSQELRVTDRPSEQCHPFVFEDKIIWREDTGSYKEGFNTFRTYDIHLYDLTRDQDSLITSARNIFYSYYGAIFGNRIVWPDKRNGIYGIYLYDLPTQTEFTILTNRSSGGICLDNDTMVWDDTTGSLCIRAYNIAQKTEKIITQINSGIIPPIAVYQNTVVWVDSSAKTINAYTGYSPWKIADCATPGSIDLYEDRVVWENGSNLSLYNMSTRYEVLLTNILDTKLGAQDPSIYGDTIAYVVNEKSTGKGNIYTATVYFVPQIGAINQTNLNRGDVFTITGIDFGFTQRDSRVVFHNGVQASIESWANGSITCKVPQNARSGTVKVVTPGGESNAVTITLPDIVPPNGSIRINNDAASTSSTRVTLALKATDDESGMGTGSQMQFSNDKVTWSAPEAYATGKLWTLTATTGTKTVYVKFKDSAGNWSGVFSDTIVFNNPPAPSPTPSPTPSPSPSPTPNPPSMLVATAKDGRAIILKWKDNSTNESGFVIERKTGTTGYTRITSVGANIINFEDKNLTPGTLYFYRLKAVGVSMSAYSNEAGAKTWIMADANGDGLVNQLDYDRINNGFANHLTGWTNGDFNGDDVINADDFFLIDSASKGM